MKCLISHRADQYITHRLEQNFEVVKIDLAHVHEYNASNHVVFVDVSDTELISQLRDQGFGLIISKFYDEILDDTRGVYTEDNCLYLYARNWCRMHSATIWTKAQYNYIRPAATPDQFFLLMMNLQREHRTRLFVATQPYHADSLYSYIEQGHYLPGDAPLATHKRGTSDQHFYNPAWYAQTNFSMVSEARVQWPARSATARFVTEKTFKPIAAQHPFVVYGTPGTLTYLHELGFETFGHVIDESYDHATDSVSRLQAIRLVLEQLYQDYKRGNVLFADAVSQQKILHNYYNFYDPGKLNQLWTTEIINPIAEFLNA